MVASEWPRRARRAVIAAWLLRQLDRRALLAAVALRLVLVGVALRVLFQDGAPFGDLDYYYRIARRSDLGQYPFLHFWMEYPPLFPFLLVGLYRALSVLQLADAASFYGVCAAFLSEVDVANLVALYRLAAKCHERRAATGAGLVYAANPITLWYSLGWFDGLAVLFLLWGLLGVVGGRPRLAGLCAGLGALAKLFPLVVLLAGAVVLGKRAAARMALAAAATVLAVLAPLGLVRHDLLLASFASLLTREPWETVWALLAGNLGWGRVVPLDQRLDASAALAGPASPLGPLAAAAQLGLVLVPLGAAVALRRRGRGGPAEACWIATLGVVALLLGGKGYSPQFSGWLVPLVLLAWPSGVGLAYVAGLCLHGFVYRALLLAALYLHSLEPSSPPPDSLLGLAWLVVLARTALLTACVLGLGRAVARADPPVAGGARTRLLGSRTS